MKTTRSLSVSPVHSSPARLPSRRERHSAAVRQRLFDAAMHLVAEHGFQATTVEEITQAADVGKGTFFNYFPSKEELLNSFGEIRLGKVRAALEAAEEGRESIKNPAAPRTDSGRRSGPFGRVGAQHYFDIVVE